MPRILALETEREGISGYLEEDGSYQEFVVTAGGKVTIEHKYPATNYINLEHFIGIMGKFDPHMAFLASPVEIDELKYDDLMELYRYFYERET